MTNTKDQDSKNESFPQLMNILNTLKDVMRNTSLTSSSNVASQIQQLLAEYGSDPKAKEILSALLSTATERDSKVYRNKTYTIEEQNILAREGNQQSLTDIIDKAKLVAFYEEDSRLKEQHEKFKLNMQKYLVAKKHQNNLKKELLEKLENGEEVDLKKYVAELIKTPEQLKKESEDRKGLFKHDDEVNKHYTELLSHDQDLKKEQKKLEKDIELEEKKPSSYQSPELARNKELLQNCLNKQNDIKPILEESSRLVGESKDAIEKVKQEEKIDAELRSNLQRHATTTREQNKNTALGLFMSTLEDQENAVRSGVMKNPQQYHELLNHPDLNNGQQSRGLDEQEPSVNQSAKLPEQSISSKNTHIPNSLKEQTAHIAENMRQKLTNKSPTINQNNTTHGKKIDDLTKSQTR
ncbi:MAG: hypothetical protein LN588_02360 [Rickettsia endosymbiont of Bryobia graminum]|nr:hypothetical protein [Rickettsia endosymbiont of Bryobia graminum]